MQWKVTVCIAMTKRRVLVCSDVHTHADTLYYGLSDAVCAHTNMHACSHAHIIQTHTHTHTHTHTRLHQPHTHTYTHVYITPPHTRLPPSPPPTHPYKTEGVGGGEMEGGGWLEEEEEEKR